MAGAAATLRHQRHKGLSLSENTSGQSPIHGMGRRARMTNHLWELAMAQHANSSSAGGSPEVEPTTRFAVVSFVQKGSRMVAEDVHYLDTYEQARVVAKFVSSRRPGVLVLSVSASEDGDDPEIVVLEQIGSGLAGATATVH